MRHIIFDAGPIISFAMNGLLPLIEKLKENFDGEFLITPQVKKEIIDRPLNVKKYKLEALQVRNLFDKGILKDSKTIIPTLKLNQEVSKIMKSVNGALRVTNTREKVKILHEGEASCLALSNLCSCDNLIVIDERTTRMIIESPDKLEKMMERKIRAPLDFDKSSLNVVQNEKIIRSTELIYIAYKKKLFDFETNKESLGAALYALKFKGTAISSGEIEEIKKIAE